MARKPENRKKAVINPRVQWTLASRVVVHFLVFVCAGAVFGLINQFLIDPFGGVRGNLAAFGRNNGPMLLALLCLLPVFIRDTLTLSNRIAGPIYNLSTTINRLADGEESVPPLQFRKGDMWGEMPQAFNTMVERLRADESADQPTTSREAELVEA